MKWILLVNLVLWGGAWAAKPNLVIFLADDFGFGNIGYHRQDKSKEVSTPNLDSLAKSGVVLDRFYTYKICSPSRCSLQTGRLPVHVNTENLSPIASNPRDVVSGYAGIPRNMTTIADKLSTLGYRTVLTGKWDAGMATPRHTPKGRGYQESLSYFHHANDYYTCGIPITAVGEVDRCQNRFLDLWRNSAPAKDVAGVAYEEMIFENHTLQAISTHSNKSIPLFLLHSFHLIHTPLQVPQEWLEKFAFIDYANRQKYAAKVNYMDASVGRIVQVLKNQGLYDNTLILFLSDNGGPIYNPGSASNFPLRGGKYADLEGGIRVNAFASGGVIPKNRRGTVSTGFMHIADVYASFLRLALFGWTDSIQEVELKHFLWDKEAAATGLPPVDSQDVLFDAIATGRSKRLEIHVSTQALIQGTYKLLMGSVPMNIWQGPQYPNATGFQPSFIPDSPWNPWNRNLDCSRGCLFDIFQDPTEHHDLAKEKPELVQALKARLALLNASEFKPNRGQENPEACTVAQNRYGGFYGPFLDLPKSLTFEKIHADVM